MKKLFFSIPSLGLIALSLSLTACQPAQIEDIFSDDTLTVHETFWAANGNVDPYPFTSDYGHIACTMNEVYYYPSDTINDESQVGLPLNRLAQDRLNQSNMTTSVVNAVKPNADLSEAIKIGLDQCEKVRAQST